MDEIIERTEEQREAIAKRKIHLKDEAIAADHAKRARAQRRVMDPKATLKMLLAKKKVTKEWASKLNEDNRARMVRLVCIAQYIDAISMTGHPVNLNPVTGLHSVK